MNYSLLMKMLSKTEVIMDKATLKISAHQNPSIWMPSVKWSANSIMMALMTKANNPKVKSVIGKENKCKIGFTNKFKRPNTMAKIIAAEKVVTCTPLRTLGNK